MSWSSAEHLAHTSFQPVPNSPATPIENRDPEPFVADQSSPIRNAASLKNPPSEAREHPLQQEQLRTTHLAYQARLRRQDENHRKVVEKFHQLLTQSRTTEAASKRREEGVRKREHHFHRQAVDLQCDLEQAVVCQQQQIEYLTTLLEQEQEEHSRVRSLLGEVENRLSVCAHEHRETLKVLSTTELERDNLSEGKERALQQVQLVKKRLADEKLETRKKVSCRDRKHRRTVDGLMDNVATLANDAAELRSQLQSEKAVLTRELKEERASRALERSRVLVRQGKLRLRHFAARKQEAESVRAVERELVESQEACVRLKSNAQQSAQQAARRAERVKQTELGLCLLGWAGLLEQVEYQKREIAAARFNYDCLLADTQQSVAGYEEVIRTLGSKAEEHAYERQQLEERLKAAEQSRSYYQQSFLDSCHELSEASETRSNLEQDAKGREALAATNVLVQQLSFETAEQLVQAYQRLSAKHYALVQANQSLSQNNSALVASFNQSEQLHVHEMERHRRLNELSIASTEMLLDRSLRVKSRYAQRATDYANRLDREQSKHFVQQAQHELARAATIQTSRIEKTVAQGIDQLLASQLRTRRKQSQLEQQCEELESRFERVYKQRNSIRQQRDEIVRDFEFRIGSLQKRNTFLQSQLCELSSTEKTHIADRQKLGFAASVQLQKYCQETHRLRKSRAKYKLEIEAVLAEKDYWHEQTLGARDQLMALMECDDGIVGKYSEQKLKKHAIKLAQKLREQAAQRRKAESALKRATSSSDAPAMLRAAYIEQQANQRVERMELLLEATQNLCRYTQKAIAKNERPTSEKDLAT